MAANKLAMKFRSVTYPNNDKSNEGGGGGTSKRSRGKLSRMDSVDFEQTLSGTNPYPQTQSASQFQQPQFQNQQYLSPSSSHMGLNSRSTRHRDLSLEGHLRVHHFKQAHSASSALAPGQKLLRFSDGSLGRSGAASQQAIGQQLRSSSCLPLSKQRGSLSPRTSNTNLERLVDWQKPSFDRQFSSPNRSLERHEVTGQQTVIVSKSQRSGKIHEKKLERFYSTDCQETLPLRSPPNEPPSNSSGNTTSSNSDTRSRRSQFRRAISLFSLSCDKETERERREKSSQKILRPPTRHVYRRGLSGLPIECTSRSLGVVY